MDATASKLHKPRPATNDVWTPQSWRTRTLAQDVGYDDDEEVEAVVQRLSDMPPLVTSWEIERLKHLIAEAQAGKRFLLQGGDCAETTADCRPTVITNKRRIPADEFFKGLFETALEGDEIITKVQFPKVNKAGYVKFPNPASRYALVGVFVSKRGSEIRVAVTGAGANGVFRVTAFEEALKKRFGAKSLEGMTIPADGMSSDIHGSAEYRAHLVGVLARRAVAAATA